MPNRSIGQLWEEINWRVWSLETQHHGLVFMSYHNYDGRKEIGALPLRDALIKAIEYDKESYTRIGKELKNDKY